ncbi:MAG: putative capsid protein [Cressdnaviricota sp.]|nr:MAG: putative capsid protein [Cressdnaviricota sp.]
MAYKRKRVVKRRWSKKKKAAPKRKVSTIRKIARQVAISTAEPKSKSTSVGKTEVFHNVLTGIAHVNAPLATYMPGLGTQDNQRVGDRILVRNFQIRCLFGQKFDRPNVTWRVMCVAQRPGLGVLTYNLLFETSTNNGMLDKINTDRVTVLWEKWIKPQRSTLFTTEPTVTGAPQYTANAVTREYTFVRRFWVTRKKTYKFESDGGAQHDDKDIWMYVLPYDAFGTLQTDNIGYVQPWVDINYKDL